MADSSSSCPHRQYMDDPGIQWREGKPDFTKVNKAYLEGRTPAISQGGIPREDCGRFGEDLGNGSFT